MIKYYGKSANGGIAIGKIRIHKTPPGNMDLSPFQGVGQEKKRYVEAKDKAKIQLQKLYEKAQHEVGEESAAIIGIQLLLIEDPDYTQMVLQHIEKEKTNATNAVMLTGLHFFQLFDNMEDKYMRARAADMSDISERLRDILSGSAQQKMLFSEPVVLIADDLTPSEAIQMDKDKILALVTAQGSVHSHTAILARVMNIPAIVGAHMVIQVEDQNKVAIVNGTNGEIIIDPDEDNLLEARDSKLAEEEAKELLQAYRGIESRTRTGQKVDVYANMGELSDMTAVLESDAEGIGLLRSEFLFLGKEDYPTEEEQFQAYKRVAEAMQGKKVIIRTLDVGADKQVPYLAIPKEENPALGYRAIRICLDRPELFKTQLRAIYRASMFGNLSIMYPMIISVSEIRQIKQYVEEVKKELEAEELNFKEIEQGIMIETPAAVFESDVLANEVDFFSIGTNDLTQYTLAIDRQNSKLDAFYDTHHPAVLKMIQMVITNGHRGNCWVGICGELGADLTLTERFLEMGIDELSLAPKFVLPVRKQICNMALKKM